MSEKEFLYVSLSEKGFLYVFLSETGFEKEFLYVSSSDLQTPPIGGQLQEERSPLDLQTSQQEALAE